MVETKMNSKNMLRMQCIENGEQKKNYVRVEQEMEENFELTSTKTEMLEFSGEKWKQIGRNVYACTRYAYTIFFFSENRKFSFWNMAKMEELEKSAKRPKLTFKMLFHLLSGVNVHLNDFYNPKCFDHFCLE